MAAPDPAASNARAETLTNPAGRWSIKHGKGLEDLYKNAAGSIYTCMGGGNLPGGAQSPGLNEQIGSGMNCYGKTQSFFGYGRGNDSKTSDGKDRGVKGGEGTENVAGKGRNQAPRQKGSIDIKGFTTHRVPMTDHDYGGNAGAVQKLAESSWYTTGLTSSTVKYGTSMTGLDGRSVSTRGITGDRKTHDAKGMGNSSNKY